MDVQLLHTPVRVQLSTNIRTCPCLLLAILQGHLVLLQLADGLFALFGFVFASLVMYDARARVSVHSQVVRSGILCTRDGRL